MFVEGGTPLQPLCPPHSLRHMFCLSHNVLQKPQVSVLWALLVQLPVYIDMVVVLLHLFIVKPPVRVVAAAWDASGDGHICCSFNGYHQVLLLVQLLGWLVIGSPLVERAL